MRGSVDAGRLSAGGSQSSEAELWPGRLSLAGSSSGGGMWGLRDGSAGLDAGPGVRRESGGGMWGLRDIDRAGGAGQGMKGGGEGEGGVTGGPAAHLPHPASGSARHGKRYISPEAAGVFSTISTLAAMGLLQRVGACRHRALRRT